MERHLPHFRFGHYDIVSAVSTEKRPLLSGDYFRDVDGPLDDLLGFNGPILAVVSEISNLFTQKTRLEGEPLRNHVKLLELQRKAEKLEAAIRTFEVPLPNDYSMSNPETQDFISTATAYRHAALIYLYKAAYDLSAPHPIVSHSVRQCLDALASIPPSSQVAIMHTWPLFTAACESMQTEDQDFARARIQSIGQRSRNAERVGELMEIVWRNKRVKLEKREERVGCIEIMRDCGALVFLV
jgi:hypothetical protein